MKFIWEVRHEWKLKGKGEDWNIDAPLTVIAETADKAIAAARKQSHDAKFDGFRLVEVKRGDAVDLIV